ncbi:MAG: gliding motility-associated C-terminal domain-containing protein [Bacteroidales bacterium]|nr:gliding motility-associated C-terminal domain-containing protein [Bacteroidales bacterium]
MIVSNTNSHWYYVRVSNGACSVIDSVYVDFQSIQVSYSTIQPSCHGYSDGSIILSPQTGTPPYHYQWSTGANTQVLNNIPAGVYSVTVTDADSCQKILQITLGQPQPLEIQLIAYGVHCENACNGKIYAFPTGGTLPYTYQWSNQQTTQNIFGLCTGTYHVTITDKNNCKTQKSAYVPVENIYANADAWADKDTIYQGQSVGIHAIPLYSFLTYQWSPTDYLLNPNSPNTTATPPHTITYYIKIDDGEGCIYDDSVTIVVLEVFCYEPYIFIPNAFTPNSDGKNDVLYVRSKYIDRMYFAIFDRWGEKVFETTNPLEGWDGTYKGKLLEPQVFDYYLEVECFGGQKFRKKGNITLIR